MKPCLHNWPTNKSEFWGSSGFWHRMRQVNTLELADRRCDLRGVRWTWHVMPESEHHGFSKTIHTAKCNICIFRKQHGSKSMNVTEPCKILIVAYVRDQGCIVHLHSKVISQWNHSVWSNTTGNKENEKTHPSTGTVKCIIMITLFVITNEKGKHVRLAGMCNKTKSVIGRTTVVSWTELTKHLLHVDRWGNSKNLTILANVKHKMKKTIVKQMSLPKIYSKIGIEQCQRPINYAKNEKSPRDAIFHCFVTQKWPCI